MVVVLVVRRGKLSTFNPRVKSIGCAVQGGEGGIVAPRAAAFGLRDAATCHGEKGEAEDGEDSPSLRDVVIVNSRFVQQPNVDSLPSLPPSLSLAFLLPNSPPTPTPPKPPPLSRFLPCPLLRPSDSLVGCFDTIYLRPGFFLIIILFLFLKLNFEVTGCLYETEYLFL